MTRKRRIVIVTPNISEQMGGEAIKAFQFIKFLRQRGEDIAVITHDRSAPIVAEAFPDIELHVVRDSLSQKFAWHSRLLRDFVPSLFFLKARRFIRQIQRDHPDAVFHYLCPVSPILLRFPLEDTTSVLGPLTGNIYYPPAFRAMEPLRDKFRRVFHFGMQKVLGSIGGERKLFRRVLVSGGDRTRRSLVWAGCPEETMIDVIDSGISDKFADHAFIHHAGVNCRFMTSGRLVPHKGVELTIEALQHVTQPILFDVYGEGFYGPRLKALVRKWGVEERVRFLGWMESHDALIDQMAQYRGYMVPSLAEANGIVVQEAMMAGLPVVCLKWGGPPMLADDESAILIEPQSRDYVVRRIAEAMDMLALDPDLANRLAVNAREIAERRFTWANAVAEWQNAYPPVARAASEDYPVGAPARLHNA